MNLASTESSPYISTGYAPSEKQPCQRRPPRGTVIATATMAILGLSATVPNWPGLLSTYQPEVNTNNRYEQRGFIGLLGLSGYSFEGYDVEKINNHLLSRPLATKLLFNLKSIVNQVYGGAAKLTLSLYSETETDEDLVVVATILSDLPIDREFAIKDQLVFDKLTEAGLTGGLTQVIIAQG